MCVFIDRNYASLLLKEKKLFFSQVHFHVVKEEENKVKAAYLIKFSSLLEYDGLAKLAIGTENNFLLRFQQLRA